MKRLWGKIPRAQDTNAAQVVMQCSNVIFRLKARHRVATPVIFRLKARHRVATRSL